MGEVFAGFDPRIARGVAIKRVRADGAAEARIQARLHHPSIARVYESLTVDGVAYVVTELVDGVSLAALARAPSPRDGLVLERACEVFLALTSAIAAAHAAGVVHCDIKAENVLVDAHGEVKLIDFGLAIAPGEAERSASLAGTPRCMSPEQTRARGVDERTDIFSLGVCIYEVLSGVSPFASRDAVTTLENVRTLVPPPLHRLRPEIPIELSALVERLLEKRPSDRPTAEAVERALATILASWRPASVAAEAAEAEPVTRQVAVGVIRLEPQDAKEAATPPHVLASAHDEAGQLIERSGGLVLFSAGSQFAFAIGYPESHDHNAERAAHIMLELRRRLEEACAGRPRIRIAGALGLGSVAIRRKGAFTGVVGTVVDEVITLASMALHDEILLTASTAGTLARGFAVDANDQRRSVIRGAEVIGTRLGVVRSADAPSAGTRLVGRDRQLTRLDAVWAEAARGGGRALLVVGEPGVGKSRLVSEWFARLDPMPRRLAMHGSEHARQVPLMPMPGFVAHLLGLEHPNVAWTSVAEAAARAGITHPAWVDALHALFEPEGASSRGASSRETLHDRLGAVLVELLADTPTVLVIEDLHWLDASTLAVLHRVTALARRKALLVVLTARGEIDDRWRVAVDLERVELSRLDESEAAAMLRGMPACGSLPSRALHAIAQHAGGVPLVLEQIALATAMSGPAHDQDSEELRRVPTSLNDSVQRRLDGLGRARRTLEALAVVGDGVPEELLFAVLDTNRDAVSETLHDTTYTELLAPAPRIGLRHALVRDAVYACIEPAVRQELHARAVDALSGPFAGLVADTPELYARHFAVAGHVDRAIELYEIAGVRARQRWAYEEAGRDLHAARTLLLEHVSPSEARDRRERDVLRSLYPAQTATHGWGDRSVQELLVRGKEIDARLGDTPALGALWGQWIMSLITHGLDGLQGALQAIGAARDSTEARFMSDLAQGVTAYHRGDLAASRAFLTLARAIVIGSFEGRLGPEETLDLSAASSWSEEVLASASLYLAVVETCCGRFAASDRLQQEAEEIARRIGSPYATSFALGVRTVNGLIRHESSCFRATLPRFEELCAGDAPWLVFSRAQLAMAHGRVAVEEGRATEGAQEFARGAAILASMGFKVSSELHAAASADAFREAGMLDAAEAALVPALEIVDHELAGIYAHEVWLAAARLSRARGDIAAEAERVEKARAAVAALKTGDDPVHLLMHHVAAHGQPDLARFVSRD